MLTIQTQVATLSYIPLRTSHESHSLGRLFSTNIVSELLEQLEMGKIIRLIPGKEKGKITSYELTRPSVNISLLDILEATGNILIAIIPLPRIFTCVTAIRLKNSEWSTT